VKILGVPTARSLERLVLLKRSWGFLGKHPKSRRGATACCILRLMNVIQRKRPIPAWAIARSAACASRARKSLRVFDLRRVRVPKFSESFVHGQVRRFLQPIVAATIQVSSAFLFSFTRAMLQQQRRPGCARFSVIGICSQHIRGLLVLISGSRSVRKTTANAPVTASQSWIHNSIPRDRKFAPPVPWMNIVHMPRRTSAVMKSAREAAMLTIELIADADG